MATTATTTEQHATRLINEINHFSGICEMIRESGFRDTEAGQQTIEMVIGHCLSVITMARYIGILPYGEPVWPEMEKS